MLKNENKIEVNILTFTSIFLGLFLLITTPLVLIGAAMYPAEASQVFSETPKSTTNPIMYFLDVTKTILEFLSLGIIAELIRRKFSMKISFTSNELSKGFIYLVTVQALYLAIRLI